jgi:hypothetical protein
VNPKEPVSFPLHLRIPGWCKAAKLAINGKPQALPPIQNGFITLDRTFSPGDVVSLDLPMEPTTQSISGGVAVERGPLVYSLKIQEDWTPVVDPDFEITNKDFPMWGAKPGSPWNYALALDADKPVSDQIQVTTRETGEDPWSNPPVTMQAPARLLEGWKLWERTGRFEINKVDTEVPYRSTPQLPDTSALEAARSAPVQKVTLVPLGTTHLRTTIFQSSRPSRSRSKPPKPPASFPPNTMPPKLRMETFRPAGPEKRVKDQWLELDLGQPTRIGRVFLSEQNWKGTRSFVIEAKQGETWKEIARGGRIGENLSISFPPVETSVLRLRLVECEGGPEYLRVPSLRVR